jgi:hypothetical protein
MQILQNKNYLNYLNPKIIYSLSGNLSLFNKNLLLGTTQYQLH